MQSVYAFASLSKGRGAWLWVIPHCPLCKAKHLHGGGSLGEDPRSYLTHRVPHCIDVAYSDEVTTYWLTDDSSLNGEPVPE